MKRSILWLLRQLGAAVRVLVIGILTVAVGAGAVYAANYALTQGSGTTFGSIVVSAVNYAQQLVCDQTTPAQCINVSAAGAAKTEGNGASGAALVGSPFRVGMSDGTNSQNWLAGIALGDGVNGNNTGAVAGWVWNGTTWDRMPGTTAGVKVASADPCFGTTKSMAPISITSSTQLITGTSAKKTYICGIDVVTATAQNIALVEGTGSVCATNIYGLAGGTTAATGWNLGANSGIVRGSGAGTVYIGSADSNATAANVCLLLSGSGQTSGSITYVQQ